jgi:ribokinase
MADGLREGAILVVGSLNMDLVTRGPRMPAKGETILASSFSTDSGGKGLNQAIACARACSRREDVNGSEHVARVAMIGAVGKDQYGIEMREELQKNGVSPDLIQRYDTSSGIATIIVDENTGDNSILVVPGANYHVQLHDFEEIVNDPKRRPSVIVLQLEIPVDSTLSVIATAKKHQIPVLLNPAPAVKLPDEALNGLDHLIMNETEAGILGNIQGEISAEHDSVLKGLFERFANLGVRNTVLTLGAQGACYSKPDGAYGRIPAAKVDKVVDTVAAGDTFVGYYAAEVALSSGKSVPFNGSQAVQRANAASAKTVQKEGALMSIPWRDEVI